MRQYSYFLFENFDAAGQNPGNPRAILTPHMDEALDFISSCSPGSCAGKTFLSRFGEPVLAQLMETGVLRTEGGRLFFDTPVFLRKDAAALLSAAVPAAERLCAALDGGMPALQNLARQVRNGFSVERNLYHILCGAVFDGAFFDALERRHALVTSRLHPSGLDYLAVIYEKCPELHRLSDGLLCSYNRLQDERCALVSFGDADGARHDLYRFFRKMESGDLSGKFRAAWELFRSVGEPSPETVLAEAGNLAIRGECDPGVQALLTCFGYCDGDRICVPVFLPEHRAIINEIARAVEDRLADRFAEELTTLSGSARITPVLHGVNSGETANELYHVLFGMMNEALVRQGVVASPPRIPGEGRYLRCIELKER